MTLAPDPFPLSLQHDIALRHFKEGMHHVKFEVDTNEPVQGHSVSGGSKDEGGKGEKKTLYDTYEGEFKNYRFDGQGTFIHASGEKYVGGWLKGKRELPAIFQQETELRQIFSSAFAWL